MSTILLLISCTSKKASVPTAPPPPPAVQPLPTRMFAPYFATWLPDRMEQTVKDSNLRYLTLAFVLGKSDSCTSAWSNGIAVTEDAEIAGAISELRKSGGDVIVSFGGAEGHELARVCKDPENLRSAYESVIRRFNLRMVDFDIETAAVRDPASVDRRNVAIAAVQQSNPGLRVSFTVEAMPSGLTDESLNLLKNALLHKVRIDVVNILAMDYGPPADPNLMGQNAIDAATHALDQLKALGMDAKLGVTVMLGKNDVSPEIFGQLDAQALLKFARNNPQVSLLSMWSIGRDHPCPAGAKVVAGTCSGIEQQAYEFAHLFQQFP